MKKKIDFSDLNQQINRTQYNRSDLSTEEQKNPCSNKSRDRSDTTNNEIMHIYLVCGRRLFQQCDTGHTWSWKFSLLPLSFQAVPLQMMPFSSTTFCGFSTLCLFSTERGNSGWLFCAKRSGPKWRTFSRQLWGRKKRNVVYQTPLIIHCTRGGELMVGYTCILQNFSSWFFCKFAI